MAKIKNIEFLRTFLILTIVIHHMFINRSWCLCNLFPDNQLYSFIKSHIAFSYNAVEGFFIIAGFLLVWTFKDKLSVKNFIKKKYIRLSPVILFSMLICLIGTILGAFHFNVIANLLTVFLLNSFGVCIAIGQNPILWFTSVIFAALLIYFCILKFAQKDFQKPLIFFLFIMSYALLEVLQHGGFNSPLKNYDFIINIGFLRGMGGVGFGCLIGMWFKANNTTPRPLRERSVFNLRLRRRLENRVRGFLCKLIIVPLTRISNSRLWLKLKFVPLPQGARVTIDTLFELILLSSVFWWLCFPHSKYNNFIFVILFALLFILFILKQGYLSKILDNDIWVFLGKYQYSMYVVHYVIIKIYGIVLWQNQHEWVLSHPVLPIIIMLLTILIATIFSYHCIEAPCAKYLKEKLIK